jgi:hypothetical protein
MPHGDSRDGSREHGAQRRWRRNEAGVRTRLPLLLLLWPNKRPSIRSADRRFVPPQTNLVACLHRAAVWSYILILIHSTTGQPLPSIGKRSIVDERAAPRTAVSILANRARFPPVSRIYRPLTSGSSRHRTEYISTFGREIANARLRREPGLPDAPSLKISDLEWLAMMTRDELPQLAWLYPWSFTA